MYSRYKLDFELENYLDFIKDKKFRFAFPKFRLASHDVAIERGRCEHIDEPGQSRSLISAFVVCCLDSIISLDSIAEISRL